MLVQFGLAKLAELAINSATGAKNRRENAERSGVAHGVAIAWMWHDAGVGDPIQAATAPIATAVHANEIADELEEAKDAEKPITNYYEVGIDESVDVSADEPNAIALAGAERGEKTVIVNGQVVEIEEEK